MDGGKGYHLRPRDRSSSLALTSASRSSTTKGGGRARRRVATVDVEAGLLAKSSRRERTIAFVDAVDVDHDATQRERSITPYVRNFSTTKIPIQPSSTKRKRRNAEIEEDTGSDNHGSDTTQPVPRRRKVQKKGISLLATGPVSRIPAPTQTPTNSKAGKKPRKDVGLTIDIEGSLLPPTPLTDGPTARRSMRIRERSTGPVTLLPPTPVLPTPEETRLQNVHQRTLSSTPSRIEMDGTPSTPEPLVVDFGILISPETPTPSTSSRRNVSIGGLSQLEPAVTPQDDFPSVPKRSDSPLIYQPVDLVPIPERSYIPSKHRRTNSKLSSPTKSVQHDDGDRTPYLASPVLFDMHPHVAGPQNLQAQETPPFARRLDFLTEHEKMESQHEGLSILANAATSPAVQTVSLRREESDIEMRLVRPALVELGSRVLHPESSVREERSHASPMQSLSTVTIPITPPATASNRSRDAGLNGLDMNRIMRNVYMGSCSVFHRSKIAQFRALEIRQIYTLRMRDEVMMDWDRQANDLIDSDENLQRTWLEVRDDSFENILPVLSSEIPKIRRACLNKPVYIHCHAGISRSAAFVVALLMNYIPKEHDNSLITCMRRVKQKRTKVSINPGFVHQLRIWEAQLNRTDGVQLRHTPEYKHWKKAREMGIVAVMGTAEDRIKTSIYLRHATPREPTFSVHQFPTNDFGEPNVYYCPIWLRYPVPKEYYRCSQCKFPLAPTDYAFHLSTPTNDHSEGTCTHRFLCNSMSWMDGQIDKSSPGGKIFCKQCAEQVGEYCWMGLRCGCGELCAPGVALTRRTGVDGDWCGWELCRVDDVGQEGLRDQRSTAPSPTAQRSGSRATDNTQSASQSAFGGGVDGSQYSDNFFDGDPTNGNANSDPNIKQWMVLDMGSSQSTSAYEVTPPSPPPSATHKRPAPQSDHTQTCKERRYNTSAAALKATPKIKKPKELRLPRAVEMSRAPRPLHHLPTSPSPLRKTWRPRRRSSSKSSTSTSSTSYGGNEIRGVEYDAVRLPTHFSEYDCPVRDSRASSSLSMDWMSPFSEVPGDNYPSMSVVGVPWPPGIYNFEHDSQGMPISGDSQSMAFSWQQDTQPMLMNRQPQAVSFDWQQDSRPMSMVSDSPSIPIVNEPWPAEELTDEDAPYEVIQESQAMSIADEAEGLRLLESSMLLDEINVYDEDMFGERNEIQGVGHDGYGKLYERMHDSP